MSARVVACVADLQLVHKTLLRVVRAADDEDERSRARLAAVHVKQAIEALS